MKSTKITKIALVAIAVLPLAVFVFYMLFPLLGFEIASVPTSQEVTDLMQISTTNALNSAGAFCFKNSSLFNAISQLFSDYIFDSMEATQRTFFASYTSHVICCFMVEIVIEFFSFIFKLYQTLIDRIRRQS